MASVFTRNQYRLEDSFAADSAILTFTGGVDPALVQNINFNYSQNVTRLYEVGGKGAATKQRTYYVAGRTQGQAGIARVIGPKAAMAKFYTQYGNVCNAKSNNISLKFNAGCSGASATYEMQGCVITNIGFSVQAMDMVFNENSALQFVDLDYTGA